MRDHASEPSDFIEGREGEVLGFSADVENNAIYLRLHFRAGAVVGYCCN